MVGIILINKPQNYTSFDIIAILRKKLGEKKIGHMGTLDPMATGVLPILLGSTAKFQIFVPENKKEYIAKIKFGIVTDTWDMHGKILSQNGSNVTKSQLENILINFKGSIDQIPPMYSAIKQNGKKLCDLARKGTVVERKPRKVFINDIELIDFNQEIQEATIKVGCSKGTYIRSLCFDIGNALGCGASMGDLCRTISNGFSIDESVDIEKIRNMEKSEIISRYILPTERLFSENKSVLIDDVQERMFRNGISLNLEYLETNLNADDNDKIIKIYNGKKFVGISKLIIKDNILKFLKCENQS